MRQVKVKGKREVPIWARDEGQEPRYLMIPPGSTIWVEKSKAGSLAVPCEYRPKGGPGYKGMVALEDIPEMQIEGSICA